MRARESSNGWGSRMAADDAKQSGGGGIVVPLLILTVIGGGLGVVSKLYLFNDGAATHTAAPAEAGRGAAEKKEDHGAPAGEHGEAKAEGNGETGGDGKGGAEGDGPGGAINRIVNMEPIVASLAKSSGAWVRLEAALVFQKAPESGYATVKSEISGDILAYLRTVSLDQIQGAEGLEYLTDDLEDIARVRSQGAVDRLVIKGLIFE